MLVGSPHRAYVSLPLILFAFYWCPPPSVCTRIKGSGKQHNEEEEGRSAGKKERKGEKEMLEGDAWLLIPIQMM